MTWLLQRGEEKFLLKRYLRSPPGGLEAVAAVHRHLGGPPLFAPKPLLQLEEAMVFAWVEGSHRIPGTSQADVLGAAFAHHLEALAAIPRLPAMSPPSGPPADLTAALERLPDGERSAVLRAWKRLAELRGGQPEAVAHLDWRPDNFLWRQDRLEAVLDWDSIGRCPAPEALGYAAARLTDSRRRQVPLEPGAPVAFLASYLESGKERLEGRAARRLFEASFGLVAFTRLQRAGGSASWARARDLAREVLVRGVR